jgi:hypothetical protein
MEVARIGAELVKLHQTNAIKCGQDAFLQAIHIYAYMRVMIKTPALLVALVLGASN